MRIRCRHGPSPQSPPLRRSAWRALRRAPPWACRRGRGASCPEVSRTRDARESLRENSYLFVGIERARFVFEHDGNIVADRKRETVGLANEFVLDLPVDERSLADGAHQDFKQFC